MTHTPGPWSIENGQRCIVRGSDGCQYVCEIVQETSEDTANTHLIAAAPEMLVALKEMLVDYRQCGMGERQVVSVAKAAIAHAEGR